MRVTTEVDVDLDQFDDADVLDAALEVIKEQLRRSRPDELRIGRLRQALGLDESTLPPPSTAATITSMADYRQWQEAQQAVRA